MKKLLSFTLAGFLLAISVEAQVQLNRPFSPTSESQGVLNLPNVPNVKSTELILNSFDGTNGSQPVAGLTVGEDGYFYGTTSTGGASGLGTVFKAAPGGVVTPLVSFSGANGASPLGKLTLAPDGNFYGTTSSGGAAGKGTIFKVTADGVLTTLASFTGGNGEAPVSGLTLGADGNFYGTASRGGPYASSAGTVFKVTPAGLLTTLVAFKVANGKQPQGQLYLHTDGFFYGTTVYGGAFAAGTVFKVNPLGELTTLVSFDHKISGAYPASGVVKGIDGNFYGTTGADLNRDQGTLFKLTPEGVLSRLLVFSGYNGGKPMGGLTIGADGNFYGLTDSGPSSSTGTAFQVTPAGLQTILVSFTGANGAHPAGGLVLASNGMFYGTTSLGGVSGKGILFALSVPKPQKITFPKLAQAKVGVPVTLTATATSGLPIAYRAQMVSGTTFPVNDPSQHIFDLAGKTTLVASQAGNLEYAAAPEVSFVVQVERGDQRLSAFPVISTRFFSPEPFTITPPVASSGLPVLVQVKSGHATIAQNKVQLTGVGEVTLSAIQRGSQNFLPTAGGYHQL